MPRGEPSNALRRLVLLAPLPLLVGAALVLRPVLEAEAVELPSWQLALLASSDLGVLLTYLLWLPGALRRGPPRPEPIDPDEPARLRLAVPLLALVVLFLPDVVISGWLSVERAASRARAVETTGKVVSVEDATSSIRLARYTFLDASGTQHAGTLRFPRVQNGKAIDLELLAALHGPVPFEVRVRYDPEHPGHSWLLGQRQTLNTLPELSILVLVGQLLVVGMFAFKPTRPPAEPDVLHPEERVKLAPIFVLACVLLMQAVR